MSKLDKQEKILDSFSERLRKLENDKIQQSLTRQMESDIRIATWNVNGITQNQAEIQVFLELQKNVHMSYI
jgi:hypothetical protein